MGNQRLSIYLLKMRFQDYTLLNISGAAHYFQYYFHPTRTGGGGSEKFQFVPDALYILFFSCILKELDFLFYSSRQSHFLVLVLLFGSTYETDPSPSVQA